MSTVARAIRWCIDVAPDFGVGLVGSSSADVAQLAAIRALDADHAAFLQAMGDAPPDLRLGDYDFSAKALIEAYGATSGKLRPDVDLFAIAKDDPWLDAVMIRKPGGQKTIELVSSCVGRDFSELDISVTEPVAGSIADLLCSSTMERVHGGAMLPFVRYGSERHGTAESMRRFLELCAGERLVEQWPTNAMTKWLVGGPVQVVARQAPGRALQVTLYASDLTEQDRLVGLLERGVDLQFAPREYVDEATMREALRARARAILRTEESWPEGIEALKRLQETLELLTAASGLIRPRRPIWRVPQADLKNAVKLVWVTRGFRRARGQEAGASSLAALTVLLHKMLHAAAHAQPTLVDREQRATLVQAARKVEEDLDIRSVSAP